MPGGWSDMGGGRGDYMPRYPDRIARVPELPPPQVAPQIAPQVAPQLAQAGEIPPSALMPFYPMEPMPPMPPSLPEGPVEIDEITTPEQVASLMKAQVALDFKAQINHICQKVKGGQVRSGEIAYTTQPFAPHQFQTTVKLVCL